VEGIFFLLILGIIAVPAALLISGFLMQRAVFQVIEIFCRQDALDRFHAKTIEELGLQPPGFLERMIKFRDYKPYALRFLAEKGIVQMTPDEKWYLVEKQLDEGLRCKVNGLLLQNRRS
jgi:hypothetical protein